MRPKTPAQRIEELTQTVALCASRVYQSLGGGFLEEVYENAVAHELMKAKVPTEQEKPVDVWYDGFIVGHVVLDLVVDGQLLVKVKSATAMNEGHLTHCIHQLRATGLGLCVLLNFGSTQLEIRRIAGKRP